VIFYADRETEAIRRALEETARRRERQGLYNEEHGIEPRTILKDIHSPLVQMSNLDLYAATVGPALEIAEREELPLTERIQRLEREMRDAAKRLEFEEAAALRDRLRELRELQIFSG